MGDDATPIPPHTVNITSGVPPTAGECANCQAWTETGFGIWGDVDWCLEVLSRFMPRSDSEGAVREAALRDFGKAPQDILEMGFGVRLCVNCAHLAALRIRTFTEGEGVLMYPQPGTVPPGVLATLS